MRIQIFSILLAASLSCSAQGQSIKRQGPPSSAPAADAADVLRALQEQNLRLASEPPTAATRFQFVLSWPLDEGDEVDALVCVDPARTSVLIRSKDGLPLWYLTEGLFVGLDPDVPGGFVLAERWVPFVTFSSDPEGTGLKLLVTGSTKRERGAIALNLGSLLTEAQSLSFNDERRVLVMRYSNSTTNVVLNDGEEAKFPVEELAMTGRGWSIRAHQIIVGGHARSPAAITREEVQKLGAPVRVQQRALDQPWSPAPSLLKNAKSRAGADALATLFRDDLRLLNRAGAATSRPLTESSNLSSP